MRDAFALTSRAGIGALAIVAALFAGCSALQIDVDVYKGPLTNDPAIQVRQYAGLAMAAKPVLVLMRRDLELIGGGTAEFSCQNSYEPAYQFRTQAAEYVNQVLRYFEFDQAPDAYKNDCIRAKPSSASQGRTALAVTPGGSSTRAEAKAALPKGKWLDGGRSATGLEGLYENLLESSSRSDHDFENEEVRAAVDELTEALIPFSERLLFVVNYSVLLNEKESAIERSILQTLGNTILLHANDLRRLRVHDKKARDGFATEVLAARVAFAGGPPAQTFGEVVQQLESMVVREEQRVISESKEMQGTSARIKAAEDALDKARRANANAEMAATEWSQQPLAHSFMTLVDPSARLAFGPSTIAPTDDDRSDAERDRQALTALFARVGAASTMTADAVRSQVLEWANREDGEPALQTARLERIRGLRKFLGRGFDLTGAPDGKPDDVFRSIIEQIGRRKVESEKDWKRVSAERTNTANRLTGADNLLAEAKRTREQIQSELLKNSQAVANAKTGLEMTKSLREIVVSTAERAGIDNPEALRGLLIGHLQQGLLASTPGNESAKAQFGQALRLVRELPQSSGIPFGPAHYATDGKSGPAPTRIQVVDDVISLLRNRRIKALSEGKESEAKWLLAAIDTAYEQRSSLVFLRPASEYLKNIYSATSLQDDNASPNRNMLIDYLRRFVPVDKQTYAAVPTPSDNKSDAAVPKQSEVDIVQARRQLEKLFWQNINRVSLTGGVSTNYAIAKDDVGNWYIKNYGSDPKAVFESAKGLALFNRGGKLDVNLLRRAELRQRSNDDSISGEERKSARDELRRDDASTSPGALEFTRKAQTRFSATYFDETKKDAVDLVDRSLKLPESIATAWGKDLDEKVTDQKSALEAIRKAAQDTYGEVLAQPRTLLSDALAAAVASNDEAAAKMSRAVADLLDAVRRYRQLLTERVAKEPTVLALPQSDKPLLPPLLQSQRRTTRLLLEEFVSRRQQAVTAYADALTTLGDVVAAK